MKIAYIGVPIGLGADRQGVEKAPDMFRLHGIINMFEHIAGCYDLGNINSSLIAEGKHTADQKVKYLNTVVDVATQLRDKVASVIKQGYFPLIVGGDHSLGLGSGAGAALVSENVGIVWFDAHGDFNTEETSPSGNLHGMPCAALMGWCKSNLNTVVSQIIPSQNFFWVGARDLDEGEQLMAQKHHLHVYSSNKIKQRGMNNIMDEIVGHLASQGISHIHLSIDIDGIDPSIVCGTGTRVANGLTNGDFYTFIDRVFETNLVRSADFVEYNPLLDDSDNTTAKWCLEALHYLAIKIKNI